MASSSSSSSSSIVVVVVVVVVIVVVATATAWILTFFGFRARNILIVTGFIIVTPL